VEGRTLGNFEIKRKLGEGGMGAVYEAVDRRLERRVAVKVLREQFAADEERHKRFLQEARTAAAVSHANIAVIHQIDEDEGVTFIAMEFIEGKPLRELIQAGAIAMPDAIRIAREISQGLAKAHESGIVHRDLKPDNVMVADDGAVKILDFGLAKLLEDTPEDQDLSQMATMPQQLTREGKVFGTAAYMSPEQARGKSVDARSDIFSFGIVLYELVTGRVPFVGETITDTISSILRDPAVAAIERNAQVPPELDRIIAKCLQKNPGDRYQDSRDLMVDLRQLHRDTDSQSMSMTSGSLGGSGYLPSGHTHSGYGSAAPSSGSGPVAHPTTSSTVTVPQSPLARAALVGVVVVAAAALVLVGMLVSGQFRSDRGSRPTMASAPTPASSPTVSSLAVHPFQNLRDPDDPERMGQILQELIITDLTEVDGLQVYSSQRLFDVQKRLNGSDQRTFDPEVATEVAERAGASTMLTGTLSQLGERWILTCQLVDVVSGTTVGSNRIDGDDLYALVDQLTGVVRGDLPSVASPATDETPLRDQAGTGSIEAYQIYLAGVEKLNGQEFEAAIALFDSTIAVAPDFARAYYPLAIAHWWANHDPSESGEPLEKLLDGELRTTERERRLASAALALVERDWPTALERYGALVEQYPDEKEAWYGYGESLYHHPEPDKMEALDAFHRAAELDPHFYLAYRHIFDVYRERGLKEEELDLAMLLFEQEPDDPERHEQVVEAYLRLGDDAAVEKEIAIGRERFPDHWTDARVTNLSARTLMREGAYQQVTHVLRDLLEQVDEDDARARVMNALGDAYSNLYAYEKSVEWLDRAYETDPTEGDVIGNRVTAYSEAGWIEEGLAMARQISESGTGFAPFADMARVFFLASRPDPDSMLVTMERFTSSVEELGNLNAPLEARRVAAWGMGNAGNHELAYDLLEPVRAMADSGEVGTDDLVALGWNAINRQNHPEAERYLSQALSMSPSSFSANGGLATLLLIAGREAEALPIAEKLLAQRPEDPRVLTTLVAALVRTGDLASALTRIDDALGAYELPETRRRLLVGSGFLSRPPGVAWVLRELGHDEEAMALVRRAHADGGEDDPEVLYALGHFELLEGNRDRALDHFHRGIRMSRSGSVSWADNLTGKTIAYLESGRPQDAERELRVLFEDGPVGVAHHRLMAYVLAEAGRHQEAETYAAVAVERDPIGLNLSALAWVLVSGSLDVPRGAELAETAVEIGTGTVLLDPLQGFSFVAPPEHTLGVAALRENRLDAAIGHLEAASEAAPARAAIQDDLEEARTKLAERQG